MSMVYCHLHDIYVESDNPDHFIEEGEEHEPEWVHVSTEFKVINVDYDDGRGDDMVIQCKCGCGRELTDYNGDKAWLSI